MQTRNYGTDRSGRSFSDAVKLAVWQKAQAVVGLNPAITRRDACGANINWADHGVTTVHGNGWEIDHIMPVARNGSDDLSNLQALQWQNNRQKSDSVGTNYCLVSAK